jgi:hypothetical protein
MDLLGLIDSPRGVVMTSVISFMSTSYLVLLISTGITDVTPPKL